MNSEVRDYLNQHAKPQDSFFDGVPDIAYDLDAPVNFELVDKGDGSRHYAWACSTCGVPVFEAMHARHAQWHAGLEAHT